MIIQPYIRPVCYHEVDRMDIVNHANYVHMAEDARVDFMRQCGVPYDQLEKDGLWLPLQSIAFQYKSSLHFGEHVQIRLKIASYNGFRISMDYTFHCAETGILCVTGTTTHIFTTPALKPQRIAVKYPQIDALFRAAQEAVYEDDVPGTD